jgi:hypothetical protein
MVCTVHPLSLLPPSSLAPGEPIQIRFDSFSAIYISTFLDYQTLDVVIADWRFAVRPNVEVPL